MKHIAISLDYPSLAHQLNQPQDQGVALPVKVLDTDGAVLAIGSTSTREPTQLSIPQEIQFAFVRLTWPSGRHVTQRVDMSIPSPTDTYCVHFQLEYASANEWSAWAIPKLNPGSRLASTQADLDLGMDEFSKVWLRLWKYQNGEWHRVSVEPLEVHRSRSAWQMDLQLDASNWLMQIGGSKVTWRFVALPGNGRARVLITPKDSSDPRADELKVVVTGFRSRAETLLEFLSRDAIRSMNAVADPVHVAQELLRAKFNDPIGAVAAAYFLLRVNAAYKVPLEWFENLSRNFRWLPDTAIVHCARLLRDGRSTHTEEFNPLKLLRESMAHGWPIFTEGVNLLQEAASLLGGALLETDPLDFHKVQALGASKGWAGAITSFYGRFPGEPDVLRWAGMPRAPRRRQIIPQLVKSRLASDLTLGFEAELPQDLPQLQIKRVQTLPPFPTVETSHSQTSSVQISSSGPPTVQIPSDGEFAGLPAATSKPKREKPQPDEGEFLLGSVAG
ncbi:hypothetical protein [Chromobacterium haemolyticum]|uniref:hypothetical protein n=1 Tax=Chromobacterium haemolyticum TaxID=394935 RepID=UPI001317FCF1|nr:hypothetical protein [Chromobacterium haemolyticum]BBH12936.1 hypothetical protein CH06BL_21840 [Chromobacterium haemolyticum]